MSDRDEASVVSAHPTLVCDLDESLVRINTFPVFVPFVLRELLRRGRLREATALALAGARRRAGRLSHPSFKAAVVESAEALPRSSIRRWAGQVVDEHLNDDVAATVRAWDGVRILSTAAPEIYAREIGNLLGFEHVQGSVLMPTGFHDNAGSGKVSRLSTIVELPVELAITDDETGDGPLIAVARAAQVVRKAGMTGGPAI